MPDPLEKVRNAAERLARADRDASKARVSLRQEMRQAHEAGASFSAIARAAGISRRYVQRLLSENG